MVIMVSSNKKLFSVMIVLAFLFAIILSSCSYNNSNYLVKEGEKVSNNNAPITNDLVRPNIPRETSPGISYSHDYDGSKEEKNGFKEEKDSINKKNYYSFLNSVNSDASFTNNDGVFRIGNVDEPFIIGKKLGDIVPFLTDNELASFIGKPAGFGLEGSGFGSGSGFKARQYLRFDFGDNSSGILRFSKDERFDDDNGNNIGAELFFEEDKPIFELAYLLEEGNFPSMVGEEISFFGEDYVIQESYNNSLLLFGRSTEKYISLSDGDFLSVNGVNYGHTIVSVDPWHFTIRVFADNELGEDGLILKPGESLRDKLSPEVFMNDYWNLYFKGLDSFSTDKVNIFSTDKKIIVDFVNRAGEEIRLPVLKLINNSILLYQKGDKKDKLHIYECKNSYDYCIKEGDYFLFTSNRGITRLFEYMHGDERANHLYFKDSSGEDNVVKTTIDKRYDFNNDLNSDGVDDMKALRRDGYLMFDDNFRVFAYYNDSTKRTNISFDMDASDGINGKTVPIILKGAHKIILEKNDDDDEDYVLNFISDNLSKNYHVNVNYYDDDYADNSFINSLINPYDEDIKINFINEHGTIRLMINKSELEFNEIDDSDDLIAMTKQGVSFVFKDTKEFDNYYIGKYLTIDAAPGYREGIVIIRG